MTMSGRTTVVGVFHDRSQAERAYDDLRRAGFTDDQLGLIARGEGGTVPHDDAGGNAGEGAVGGILTGGTVGGIVGALAAGLIPGIGPVIATGILAGILGGAAVGAATGGLLGALMGAGVPEDEAKYYNDEFESGRTLVTVRAGNRFNEARDLLRRMGAYDIEQRGSTTMDSTRTMDTGTTGTTGTMGSRSMDTGSMGSGSMGTGSRGSGSMGTGSRGSGSMGTGSTGSGSGSMGSGSTGMDRDSTGMGSGSSGMGSGSTGMGSGSMGGGMNDRWDDVMGGYRTDWERRYGTTGARWEDAEPAYRFGYQYARDPRYSGRDFSQVEPDLRREWETGGQRSAWDSVRMFLRDAWDNMRGQGRRAA